MRRLHYLGGLPTHVIEHGLQVIGYASLVELGFLLPESDDWRERYRRLLVGSGELLTERLISLPGPVCLLCVERRPEDCHRTLIAGWRAERGWEVEHLV